MRVIVASNIRMDWARSGNPLTLVTNKIYITGISTMNCYVTPAEISK